MTHSLDLTKFLSPGSQCRIGAHVVPFPGDPRHRAIGYDQASPAVIRRQADLMQDCGISFITLDWYGTKTRSQLVLTGWMAEAERRGQFSVAVMADKDSDPTSPLMTPIYASPAYLDHLLLTFPGNWNQPLPPTLRHLSHGSGFLWMELPPAGSLDTPLSILKRQYSRGQTVMGAIFSGFNDSDPKNPASSVWGGPARHWDDYLGETWLECWRVIPAGLKYVQLVTWNDYEEGTALEGTLAMLSGTRI